MISRVLKNAIRGRKRNFEFFVFGFRGDEKFAIASFQNAILHFLRTAKSIFRLSVFEVPGDEENIFAEKTLAKTF